MNNFYTCDLSLKEMLMDIQSGKIQLPDFQRDWRWSDKLIRSLISSVLQSFPIGAIMMLETDSKNRRFKVRMLEGVNSDHAQNEPTALILDGQQRLTALFQSLMSGKPVSTLNSGGDEVLRWYYIDMEQCIKVDGDRETAIISRRTDGQLR
ncbi:MAG: DUF262 domain-containing protein [Candidatus Poribacteria bacterium]|nr:DUF262 domain-containing protein [Candidatus Poribacteria bacterium]